MDLEDAHNQPTNQLLIGAKGHFSPKFEGLPAGGGGLQL